MSKYYFEKIKRLHALAEIGLEYNNVPYDIERYQEIRDICLEMLEKKNGYFSSHHRHVPG